MFDWNITLTGIALVAAVLSPVITTILTNRFQLKMKKSELLDQRKLDVINGYLEAASETLYTFGVSEGFQKYSAVIFLYSPRELHEKIRKLNKLLEGTELTDECTALLYDVADALRTENKIG